MFGADRSRRSLRRLRRLAAAAADLRTIGVGALCRDCPLRAGDDGWCAGHQDEGEAARAWAEQRPDRCGDLSRSGGSPPARCVTPGTNRTGRPDPALKRFSCER
jgi:hypothetical protein